MSELGGSNDGKAARSPIDEAVFQRKRNYEMTKKLDREHNHATDVWTPEDTQRLADADYWYDEHGLEIESLGGTPLHAAVPVDKIGVQTEQMTRADEELLRRLQNQPFRLMLINRTPALYEWHDDNLGPLDENGGKTSGPPNVQGGLL